MDGRARTTRESTLGRDANGTLVLHPNKATVLSSSDHGTRRAACCLFGCNVFLGPLMLIGGIILLTYPNDRNGLISTFNTDGSEYSSSDVFTWSGGSEGGAIAGLATTTRFHSVQPSGDPTDIDIFNSYFASVFVPFSSFPANPEETNVVRFELNEVIPFTRVVIPTISQTQIIYCDDKHGCIPVDLMAMCTAQYGNSATYSGDGCFTDGPCGICRIILYLQSYCAVVTSIVPLPPEDQSFAESDHYRSCLYPFTSADQQQVYGPTQPATIEFKVLRKGDPFLLMQSLTQGTMDFGVSAADLRKSGTILAVIGSIFIVLALISGYCIRQWAKEENKKDNFLMVGTSMENTQEGDLDEAVDSHNVRRSFIQKSAYRSYPSVLQQQ